MEESIRASFSLKESRPELMSPHSLAYVGDAVYELIIRTIIVESGETSSKEMNKKGISRARASAQALTAGAIKDELTPQELDILRRGRNAHPGVKAKHATMSEYRRATGLETLVGYLYLKGDIKRLCELLRLGWEKTDDEK